MFRAARLKSSMLYRIFCGRHHFLFVTAGLFDNVLSDYLWVRAVLLTGISLMVAHERIHIHLLHP